jgi:hypothetical protein
LFKSSKVQWVQNVKDFADVGVFTYHQRIEEKFERFERFERFMKFERLGGL